MSFRDMAAADVGGVFLNTEEFADIRTLRYDGEDYIIPAVMSNFKERDRRQLQNDHAAGLYQVTQTLHCALAALGGVMPEKGARIEVSDETGYMESYYVASSASEAGMLRIELEAINE